MKKNTLESAARETTGIRERLREENERKAQLQMQFDTIMQQPFFKRQTDNTGL